MDGSFREGGRWREVRTRSRGCARIYARPLGVGILEAKGALSRSTNLLSKIWGKNADSFGTNNIWAEMEKRVFRKMIRILCKNASKLSKISQDL